MFVNDSSAVNHLAHGTVVLSKQNINKYNIKVEDSRILIDRMGYFLTTTD